MATLFAVLGVFALVGATGAVETDQWVLALALFVMGTCTYVSFNYMSGETIMIKGEEGLITAILTQSVEDAKYTGFNKHRFET